MRSRRTILTGASHVGNVPHLALEVLLDIRDILSKDLPKINKNLPKDELTLFDCPVVNIRTGKRVKREDLEGKVWYIDLKNMRKKEKKND